MLENILENKDFCKKFSLFDEVYCEVALDSKNYQGMEGFLKMGMSLTSVIYDGFCNDCHRKFKLSIPLRAIKGKDLKLLNWIIDQNQLFDYFHINKLEEDDPCNSKCTYRNISPLTCAFYHC